MKSQDRCHPGRPIEGEKGVGLTPWGAPVHLAELRNINESNMFGVFHTSAKGFIGTFYFQPTLNLLTFDLHPEAKIHSQKPNTKPQTSLKVHSES